MIRQINCCQSIVWQLPGKQGSSLLVCHLFYTFVYENGTSVTAHPVLRQRHFRCTLHVFCRLCWNEWKSWKLTTFAMFIAFLSSFFLNYSVSFWPPNVVSHRLENRNLFTIYWKFCPLLCFLSYHFPWMILNSHSTGWACLHWQEHYLIDSCDFKVRSSEVFGILRW